jgi:hypothetical protein
MFRPILERLGILGRKPKQTVSTVRLEIIAEQVREFTRAKEEMSHKLDTLETKTNQLDQALNKTLDMTRENQQRLDNIEGNLEKVIAISEALLKSKQEPSGKEVNPRIDGQ